MSNRTLALIIALIIVTGGLLILALSPSYPKKTNTTQTAQKQTASTTLSLLPNPFVFPSSTSSAQLTVGIDTGTNKVTAVQVELTFDPKAIAIKDIMPSTFLKSPVVFLKNIDNVNGRVSFALGIQPNGVSSQGKGNVATFTIANNYSGVKSTGILFLPKSLATAVGITSSVLKATVGTTILFATPTPIPVNASPSAH